jgi:hypothetical protein
LHVQTLISLIAAVPIFLAAHPIFAAFALLVALTLLAVLIGRTIREGAAQDPHRAGADLDDEEDHLRFLRISADDAGLLAWRTGGHYPAGLYRSTAVAALPPAPAHTSAHTPAPALDARTAELVIDPTLKAADVAQMVEHVAPGPGSVVSVAAVAEDTRLRGPRATAELEAAEAEAHDEALVRDFAGFDQAMADAFARLDRLQWRQAAWSFYVHAADGHACPHCTEAVTELTGEYQELTARVLAESTQAMDLRELRAALAAA